MSRESRVKDVLAADGVTVSFGQHFQASEQFDTVFREGMALVDQTAAYLDGAGRRQSKQLKAPITALYATESMRLTTRLLDLASWLLIRRALKEGEINEIEAAQKRKRIKLQSLSRPSHVKGFEQLPEELRELIEASFALHDRIIQLDRAMSTVLNDGTDDDGSLPSVPNPVASQMSILRSAFGAKAS